MSIQGAIEAEAKWREIIQKRGHTAKRCAPRLELDLAKGAC